MYYTMRRDFYFPRMVNYIYSTVSSCEFFIRMRVRHHKHLCHLKRFPATGPLYFVGIDILRPLTKAKDGNLYFVVITDRNTKLKLAIPSTKTTAPYVAAILLDHCIIPYGIPTYSLKENGPQFVGKFFAVLSAFLG